MVSHSSFIKIDICVYHAHVGTHRDRKRMSDALERGVMGSCEPPGIGAEPESSKEQQLHLNFIFSRNKFLLLFKIIVTGCFGKLFLISPMGLLFSSPVPCPILITLTLLTLCSNSSLHMFPEQGCKFFEVQDLIHHMIYEVQDLYVIYRK